jgi:hypothetical protein
MPDPTPTPAITAKIRRVLEEALDATLPSGQPDTANRLRAVELILRPNAGVRSEAEALPSTAVFEVSMPDDVAEQLRAQARPNPRRQQDPPAELHALRPEDALPPPRSRARS